MLPESGASLWKLAAGPTTWALHFLLSYVTGAIWCAKVPFGAGTSTLHLVLWAYTVIALVVIAAFGWRGLRQHRHGAETLPHDDASAGDRHRFLGFATFLLCCLSAVAVLYAALAIVIVGRCFG